MKQFQQKEVVKTWIVNYDFFVGVHRFSVGDLDGRDHGVDDETAGKGERDDDDGQDGDALGLLVVVYRARRYVRRQLGQFNQESLWQHFQETRPFYECFF